MIKRQHLISIFLCIFFSVFLCMTCNAKGTVYNPKIYVGTLQEDYNICIIGGNIYPLYQINEDKYIPLIYLEKMGLNKEIINEVMYFNYGDSVDTEAVSTLPLKDKPVSLSNQIIYIGPLRTYAIEVDGQILIPLDALKVLWQFDVHQGAFIIRHSWLKMNHFVSIDEKKIRNTSQMALSVDLLHIFWNGKNLINQYELGVNLKPSETREKYAKNLGKNGQYMTTIILQINGFTTQYRSGQLYGQKNEFLLNKYESEKRRDYLTKLFPAFKIVGTMRYNVGNLKANDQ